MGEQVNFEVNEIEIMSGYPKNLNFKGDNYSSDRRFDENLPSREASMNKYDYIKQSWHIGLFLLFWILTICGTYTISPLVRASFDREQIKAETGQYPLEIVNPIKLSELNQLAKQAGDPTVILIGSGKILLEK
ncbi:hypothetical protein [Campylobacter concisus]|uniref:hypothetical protein n=1 Tax=Campylobacter concisus TaxID=199 RepID=UPI0015E1A1D6|nr:hypothetical protein [Campylobacter concisus]